MSFRRARNASRAADKEERAWLASHWPSLRAMGVPPEVTRSLATWRDFLENGELHWERPTSGWTFHALDGHAALLELLRTRYTEKETPLIAWLRVRTKSVDLEI